MRAETAELFFLGLLLAVTVVKVCAAGAPSEAAGESVFESNGADPYDSASRLANASCDAECVQECLLGVCLHPTPPAFQDQAAEETVTQLLGMASTFSRSAADEYNVTVILNPWHRPHLLRPQLQAISNQTIPVAEVWIALSDSPVQEELRREAASTCAEEDLQCHFVVSSKNFVYYLPFQLGLQATTRYLWFMDDDVLPAYEALEYMLHVSNTEAYRDSVLGGRGTCEWMFAEAESDRMLPTGHTYKHPHQQLYCWCGMESTVKESENLDGGRFMRRELLRLLFREEPGAGGIEIPFKWLSNDLQLTYALGKYGGTRSYVLPCEGYPNICPDSDITLGQKSATNVGERIEWRGKYLIRLFQRGGRQVWTWKLRNRNSSKRLVLLFAHTFEDAAFMAELRRVLQQSENVEPHVVVTGAEPYTQDEMRHRYFAVSDEDYDEGLVSFSTLQLGKDLPSGGKQRKAAGVAAEVLEHMGELLEALQPSLVVLPHTAHASSDPICAAAAMAAQLAQAALVRVRVHAKTQVNASNYQTQGNDSIQDGLDSH